ncbi:MAG: hypothetical protein ACRC6T_14140 [Sarcina sp.]
MSAKINNLRNLRKKDFEVIKELSLLGAHVKNKVNKGISCLEQEALFNLISRCGDERIDETGKSEYDMDVNEELIDNYNELIFWSVLAKKLAARDIRENFGDGIDENNYEAYKRIKKEYEEKYLRNFGIYPIFTESEVTEKGIIFDNNLLPY